MLYNFGCVSDQFGENGMRSLSIRALEAELAREAQALGIPSGAGESFAHLVAKKAMRRLKQREVVTEKDVDMALYQELKNYNADLAYVYKNRDIII